MALESMAADLANLRGYHTKLRVPYRSEAGAGGRPGDLDVVGVNSSGKMLAVECKAFGSPLNYPNWNTETRTDNLTTYVREMTTQVGELLDPAFDRDAEFDVLWVVWKGYFAESSTHGRSVEWNSKSAFEEHLQAQFGVEVELLPTHELVQKLIEEVDDDMRERRLRYASPTLELFRQLVAIGQSCPEEINAIAGVLRGDERQ